MTTSDKRANRSRGPSVSVNRHYYEAFRHFCKSNDVAMTDVLEARLRVMLDEHDEATNP